MADPLFDSIRHLCEQRNSALDHEWIGLDDDGSEWRLSLREIIEELKHLQASKLRLRDAAAALYYAGHWHCDRPVDEITLWTELRDAASFEPGHAPGELKNG